MFESSSPQRSVDLLSCVAIGKCIGIDFGRQEERRAKYTGGCHGGGAGSFIEVASGGINLSLLAETFEEKSKPKKHYRFLTICFKTYKDDRVRRMQGGVNHKWR